MFCLKLTKKEYKIVIENHRLCILQKSLITQSRSKDVKQKTSQSFNYCNLNIFCDNRDKLEFQKSGVTGQTHYRQAWLEGVNNKKFNSVKLPISVEYHGQG